MSREFGDYGENMAAGMLKEQGFEIISRNFHSRFGEIDIIAANEAYICFVEVKMRKAGSLVSPLEAVTEAKRKKIILTAKTYLLVHPTELQPRFDVAAVTIEKGRCRIEYIENAFCADART